jgi:two-component system, OmpR family, sensor kinase
MRSLESQLKRRLTLGVIVIGIVLSVAVRTEVKQQQAELLDYQLEQLARVLLQSNLQADLHTWDDDSALHLDVQMWDAQGHRLYRSSEEIEFGSDTPAGFSSVQSGSESDAVTLRVFTLSNTERKVQIMHSQDLRDSLSVEAELEVLVPALLAMLLTAIIVIAAIKKGMEPLRELDDALNQRSANSLAAIELPDAPSELGRVVQTLNRLLEQLNASMQAHKRFIADAAHELRTPITALGLEINNLMNAQGSTQMLETAARLKVGTQRAQHLLLQMLTLARLENRADSTPWVDVDLLKLAQESMVGLSALGSYRGIEFSLESSGSTVIQGNPDDLRVLLDNLLGNALKFSPENSVVNMRIYQQAGTVTLLLRDHGPGIASQLRQRIFLPFVRADSATPGSGLGLTIALEVVTKHGATLALEDPSEGQGLQVRVNFLQQAASHNATY